MEVVTEELIEQIRDYVLLKTRKHYLGRIKTTPDDIMVCCPYHKDGQEKNPSMGISKHTTDRVTIGTCNCLACHMVTDLSSMVKYMLGDKYDEDDVEARFNLKTTIARETVIQENKLNVVQFKKPNYENYVGENTLREYRIYHPYLASRNISEYTAKIYDIGYDKYNNHITFPIRDIMKRCVGLGRRAIDEKKYIYPMGFEKPLYGVYELPSYIKHLYCVEGPFNLWSLYEYNKVGVALLGTGTQAQYKQLLNIECKDYVLALDGDDAGHNGTRKLGNFLEKNNKKVYVADVPIGQDINDMSYEQFANMEILTFKEWSKKYS